MTNVESTLNRKNTRCDTVTKEKTTPQGRLPQHCDKQECTHRRTEQKGVQAHLSMMVGGNRAGRGGPAHHAVASGFSEWTERV